MQGEEGNFWGDVKAKGNNAFTEATVYVERNSVNHMIAIIYSMVSEIGIGDKWLKPWKTDLPTVGMSSKEKIRSVLRHTVEAICGMG